MKDPQATRVYLAENKLRPSATHCRSWREAQRFLDTIFCSSWFTREYGYMRYPVRRISGIYAMWQPSSKQIQLPTWALNKLVILHELAHAVTPMTGPDHGWRYCRNYLFIVRHVFGAKFAGRLRYHFKRNQVRYTPKAAA